MITLPRIPPPDDSLAHRLRARIDGLAKPPGSLGRLEDLAVRIGLIQNRMTASASSALLLVFAGDHGLTAEGVSAYPAAVTIAMVETFLAGRASANALARAVGAELRVVDAGMARDISERANLIKQNVRRGTRNAVHEPALTPAEVDTALSRGISLGEAAAVQGFDMLALGEMGIGNSASAALIMHCLTGIALDQCVGRGAGHDDAGLARKRDILTRAHARAPVTAPHDVLAEFAGCEIAMMAGAVLGAAAARRVILVDGFISTAAALAAIRLDPAARSYCVFTHRSAEAGHRLMLDALQAQPLLDLDMRLGEGTGALLAVPMVRAAAQLLTQVATLEEVLKGAS